MCGIVGYVGNRPVSGILIQGLRRLEYRGYDSTGVAFLIGKTIYIEKSEGRFEKTEKLIEAQSALYGSATCGLGHTRWATHGKPTTENAHPHKVGHVVLVHNGIIENYLEIKQRVLAQGHKPVSETDSELLGFLVFDGMEKGQSLVDAVRGAYAQIRGQCSVVVMSEREPGVMVGVRNGSPLVATLDPEGGMILASDAQPLIAFNKDVYFLDHGDLVVGTKKGFEFFNLETSGPVQRKSVRIDGSPDKLDKGGFPHYMLKEIYEQPQVLIDTLNSLLNRSQAEPFRFQECPALSLLDEAQELTFVACGTSWHAALLGKYWLEKWAKISVNVELSSEFRYREPILKPGTVVVGISQSGETADTLAVLREMRKRGVKTLGISNVRGSSIEREADGVFYTAAGPEVGVAATKTFLAQMLTLFLMAGHLSFKRKSVPLEQLTQVFENLLKIPHILAAELEEKSDMVFQIKKAAHALENVKGFFFMGRGYSYPMALEGALKLKEIAYDYSEGYAAGELKHGPIAMIDRGMVVVVLAPRDPWRDKTVSNLEEVKARGATIVGIGDSDDRDLRDLCDHWIPLPPENRWVNIDLLPFILAPVVHLWSYHRAILKKTDVDKPRNLAKSVTVE